MNKLLLLSFSLTIAASSTTSQANNTQLSDNFGNTDEPTPYVYTGDTCEDGTLDSETLTVLNNWAGAHDWCNITQLVLSNSELTSVPKEIGALMNLTLLYLNGNNISKLPDSIGNLTNLMYLRLENNSLSTAPDSIGNLKSLIILELSNNYLTMVPNSIGNLTNLERLFLSDNFLTTMPDNIGNLTNLVRLDLKYNALTTIPDNIGNLKNRFNMNYSLTESGISVIDPSLESYREFLSHLTVAYYIDPAHETDMHKENMHKMKNFIKTVVDKNYFPSNTYSQKIKNTSIEMDKLYYMRDMIAEVSDWYVLTYDRE